MALPDKSDEAQFPAGFQEISKPRVGLVFGIGILACFSIAVVNIVQANDLLTPEKGSLWHAVIHFRILGTDAAISLFSALLAGLLAYRQFYTSHRPHLTYNCVRAHSASFSLAKDKIFWTTILRNGGGGLARVTRVAYAIRLVSGAQWAGGHYAEAIAFLEENGIREGTDFVLFRLSPGETIRAGGDWMMLEIDLALAMGKIVALDVSIQVTSVAGGMFERSIYCVPRRWTDDRARVSLVPCPERDPVGMAGH